MKGIQNSGDEGRQADKEHEGKHVARERHGQGEAFRGWIKTAGDETRQLGREDNAQKRDGGQNDEEGREHRIEEALRLFFGLFLGILREDGNEGRRQRAFAEQAPEKIGDAECRIESVGGGAGAEKSRDHRVPAISEDPGEHGGARKNARRAG